MDGDVMSTRLDRISVNPEIMHGAPIIRGMRFRVRDVLDLLASDMSHEEILEDYPYLEKEDLLAALEFAALENANRRMVFAGAS